MNFHFTEEQDRFRQEIRDLLDRELPPDWKHRPEFGGAFEEPGAWEVGRHLTEKAAERNWLAMGWPKEYGGLGKSAHGAGHLRRRVGPTPTSPPITLMPSRCWHPP